jgi:hypothetical protein
MLSPGEQPITEQGTHHSMANERCWPMYPTMSFNLRELGTRTEWIGRIGNRADVLPPLLDLAAGAIGRRNKSNRKEGPRESALRELATGRREALPQLADSSAHYFRF